jgi:SAP domain
VFEARGFQRVDDPNSPGVADTSVEAAEVDGHGIGWVYVEQTIDGTLRTARIPLEPGVLEDHRDKGWRLVGETESAEDKTVAELRAELKNKGLPTSGTKQELIDRLNEAPVEPDTTEE